MENRVYVVCVSELATSSASTSSFRAAITELATSSASITELANPRTINTDPAPATSFRTTITPPSASKYSIQRVHARDALSDARTRAQPLQSSPPRPSSAPTASTLVTAPQGAPNSTASIYVPPKGASQQQFVHARVAGVLQPLPEKAGTPPRTVRTHTERWRYCLCKRTKCVVTHACQPRTFATGTLQQAHTHRGGTSIETKRPAGETHSPTPVGRASLSAFTNTHCSR